MYSTHSVLAGPQHVRRLVHVPHEGGGPAAGLCRLRARARLQVRCFTALDRGAPRSAAVGSVLEMIVELQRELQVSFMLVPARAGTRT